MKISNETKVGALAAVSITILVLGYNFLKGKDLFTSTHTLYVTAPYNPGLSPSNPVYYNGLKVGQVTNIDMINRDNREMVVIQFNGKKKYKIPNDSKIICFSADFFGSKALKIEAGTSLTEVKSDDTLTFGIEPGLTENLSAVLNPIREKVEHIVNKIDSAFDKDVAEDLSRTLSDLQKSMESIKNVTAQLDIVLNSNKDKISATFTNLENVSTNLAKNNEKINSTIDNLKKTSENLAAADLQKTVEETRKAMTEVQTLLTKINKGEGSLGQLANDKALYENLKKATDSLDKLLADLKTNPKRYLNFSVFEKKDKSNGK